VQDQRRILRLHGPPSVPFDVFCSRRSAHVRRASLSEETHAECYRRSLPRVADAREHLECFLATMRARGNTVLTSISPNGACKVRVNCTSQAVVSKSLFGHAPRAEILCGQHATRRHNPDKCVECRLFAILQPTISVRTCGNRSSKGTYNTLIQRCC
jgi:hypothetical protein